MLKFVIIFTTLIVLSSAGTYVPRNFGIGEEHPADNNLVPIVKSLSERKPDGSYSFTYEGADGSSRQEMGHIEHADNDDILEVSGEYRYYDADGQLIEVHYTAGKNGFVPRGTNIPEEISAAAQAAAEYAKSEISADV